jgi:hypothetical protein
MQQTQFAGTVDKAFTYNGHCAVIGDLKRPGIITTDWGNNTQDSTNKQRLARELRRYVPNDSMSLSRITLIVPLGMHTITSVPTYSFTMECTY